MQTEHLEMTVKDVVELFANKLLSANPEYQRGTVWSKKQKRKLIDSVFRHYPLPMIYLHHIKKTVAGIVREDFEIIDGQQRITALYEFEQGAFNLYDPIKDDNEAKFPGFIKNSPCPWGGQKYSELPEELRQQLLATKLYVVKINTMDPNDVRDLFVRLQSGLPLNAQETRDALPGAFTDFILSVGGKPEIAKYPGHKFFQETMGLNPRTDRGKTRTVAAQLAMLLLTRLEKGRSFYPDINAISLNDFYYSHVDFDRKTEGAQRLIEILDCLDRLLSTGKRPKLKAHDAIHLVLLLDGLWDDYTPSWKDRLGTALDQFFHGLADAKKDKEATEQNEFWTRYGQWTRVNSDRGDTIGRRHIFYLEKMFEYLSPLQPKDPKRTVDALEREIMYYRSRKLCAVCNSEVLWDEVEIHHIDEHSKGGKTDFENSALVHRECHPKTETTVQNLRQKLNLQKTKTKTNSNTAASGGAGFLWQSTEGYLFLPNGTDLKLTYKQNEYFGKVMGDEILVEGVSMTPSKWVHSITQTSRNAWKDIWFRASDGQLNPYPAAVK
jgi:hypothetical protein